MSTDHDEVEYLKTVIKAEFLRQADQITSHDYDDSDGLLVLNGILDIAELAKAILIERDMPNDGEELDRGRER